MRCEEARYLTAHPGLSLLGAAHRGITADPLCGQVGPQTEAPRLPEKPSDVKELGCRRGANSQLGSEGFLVLALFMTPLQPSALLTLGGAHMAPPERRVSVLSEPSSHQHLSSFLSPNLYSRAPT